MARRSGAVGADRRSSAPGPLLMRPERHHSVQNDAVAVFGSAKPKTGNRRANQQSNRRTRRLQSAKIIGRSGFESHPKSSVMQVQPARGLVGNVTQDVGAGREHR